MESVESLLQADAVANGLHAEAVEDAAYAFRSSDLCHQIGI